MDSGRADDASELLAEARPLYEAHGEHFDRLPRLWLEGRIASQSKRTRRRSTSSNRFARPIKRSMSPMTSLSSPSISRLVWLRQGKTAEIEALLDESIVILRARNLNAKPSVPS